MPPRKRAAAPASSRQKAGPTPARPRAAGAAPVPEPKPDAVVLEDGTAVVFSFSQWLTKAGLDETKPVEAGGRVWDFRPSGSMEENTRLYTAMATGNYKAALELMLADPDEVGDLMAVLRVPFATRDESRMWLEFTQAVSGVTLPESPAS